MKNLKLSMLAFLTAGLLSSFASAADTAGYTKVTQIKAWTNGDASHIYTENTVDGRHTCDNFNEFRLAKSQVDIFRMLTAAQLGGRAVRLQYTCSGTTANITGVRML